MNKPFSEEMRHEFAQWFAACATANPHMTPKDREQCEKALDLVAGVVRGTLSRGAPTYIDADDLIQECLIRLPNAIRDFRGKNGSSVKTYLKAVIRNDIMDAIKRERRRAPIGGVVIDAGGTKETAEGDRVGLVNDHARHVSRKEAALDYSRVIAADAAPAPWETAIEGPEIPISMWEAAIEGPEIPLSLLTDEQLDVVKLCDLLGLTQDEAARRLGTSRNAVASRLRKAHTKLRKAYTDSGHPVPRMAKKIMRPFGGST